MLQKSMQGGEWRYKEINKSLIMGINLNDSYGNHEYYND